MRRALTLTGVVCLTAVGAATVLALFARQGWVAELFAHFRPWYLVVLACLGGLFAIERRRKLVVAAAILALPNAWFAAPYLLPAIVPSSVAAPAGRQVSMVALNLFVGNEDHARVRDYLRRSDADVLVLSELTPDWVSALAELLAGYPYAIALDRSDPWGLGMYSRYPLREAGTTDLGAPGSVNVFATLALPDGEVRLVGVHLASPTSPQRAAARNRQLGELATLLGPSPAGAPRLLVGDLNLTPFSPHFADLLTRTRMVDARRQLGATGTWPAWPLPLRIAIDHCIADPSLPLADVRRGPAVGSDHYPLEITLRGPG